VITIERWAQRATELHRRHRKAINGGVIASLAGFSAVALGIAPLAPDAADLPQRLVVEEVAVDDIAAQIEALASNELELTRADLTRSTDTASGLLSRLGVVDDEAASFLAKDPAARQLLQGRAGKMVQVQAAEDGRLLQLVARYPAEKSAQLLTHFTRLTLSRVGDAWQTRVEQAKLDTQVQMASSTIRSSLFAAADEARIPDTISIQMAEIFANEIDFQRDLRGGDTFSVVYEALAADGEPITWNSGTGRVLATEFNNAGRTYQAVWYPTGNGKGGYFALDGTSKQRTFLSSPLAFSRVTSGFAMRFHPILKTWRQHKGVDYAAPRGTPIRSVGAGVVEFAGWQNGYGNAVEIRHGNGRQNFYAHMSRLDVRKGQRIEQGDPVGAVGSTGWSTGPHLHFEFRVNGQQQNPRVMAAASEAITLPPALKARFLQQADLYKTKLAIADSLLGTTVGAE